MFPSTSQFLVRIPRHSSKVANFGATSTPPAASTAARQAAVDNHGYIGYLQGAFSSLWQTLPWGGDAPLAAGAAALVQNKAEIAKQSRAIVRKTSRNEVTAKTNALVKRLLVAESTSSRLLRINDLCAHLSAFPPSRLPAVQDPRLIAYLLELERNAADKTLRSDARLCLVLCGYVRPPKGAGVNLLTIDGGGTRGMMGLEVLEALERASGDKKVHEMFDHIVGVSTGAIIAVLLGVKKLSVREARQTYMDISRQLFSQTKVAGLSGLLLQHSYYNTKKWITILKEILGEESLASTARDPAVPRISIVSCIVNLPILQPYIFRNYEPPAGRDSHYRGCTASNLWQAVQASAAAPGYFEEVVLEDSVLLQDGGVFANNPTSIGVHETKSIWPEEAISCLISIGNGRTVTELDPTPLYTSSRAYHKLLKIIDSATDTEAVHMATRDLLTEKVYYRLNPYMTHPYGLDEIAPDRLDQMQTDARLYVRRNMQKIELAAERLAVPASLSQTITRRIAAARHRYGWYAPP